MAFSAPPEPKGLDTVMERLRSPDPGLCDWAPSSPKGLASLLDFDGDELKLAPRLRDAEAGLDGVLTSSAPSSASPLDLRGAIIPRVFVKKLPERRCAQKQVKRESVVERRRAEENTCMRVS